MAMVVEGTIAKKCDIQDCWSGGCHSERVNAGLPSGCGIALRWNMGDAAVDQLATAYPFSTSKICLLPRPRPGELRLQQLLYCGIITPKYTEDFCLRWQPPIESRKISLRNAITPSSVNGRVAAIGLIRRDPIGFKIHPNRM